MKVAANASVKIRIYCNITVICVKWPFLCTLTAFTETVSSNRRPVTAQDYRSIAQVRQSVCLGCKVCKFIRRCGCLCWDIGHFQRSSHETTNQASHIGVIADRIKQTLSPAVHGTRWKSGRWLGHYRRRSVSGPRRRGQYDTAGVGRLWRPREWRGWQRLFFADRAD